MARKPKEEVTPPVEVEKSVEEPKAEPVKAPEAPKPQVLTPNPYK